MPPNIPAQQGALQLKHQGDQPRKLKIGAADGTDGAVFKGKGGIALVVGAENGAQYSGAETSYGGLRGQSYTRAINGFGDDFGMGHAGFGLPGSGQARQGAAPQ